MSGTRDTILEAFVLIYSHVAIRVWALVCFLRLCFVVVFWTPRLCAEGILWTQDSTELMALEPYESGLHCLGTSKT